MGIQFFEEDKVFKLDTKNSTYMIAVIDEEQFLGHVYYGKKVIDQNMNYLLRTKEPPYVPSVNERDRVVFFDSFPFEYPTFGVGDFRESCLNVETINGHSACSLSYVSHEIRKGKTKLEGLPATYGLEEECTMLEITCMDPVISLEVVLCYTLFEELDVITKNVRIRNQNKNQIILTKVLSSCLNLEGMDYDMITLNGSWARERYVERKRIGYGEQGISSIRGESGHQQNPFLAILSSDATEDYGEVYGFNFVYSGNFIAKVQGCQFDNIRVIMGIHPETFRFVLETNQEFQSPEVVMVYSDIGIGGMTRTFHDLYRNHLIRGEYKDKKRPVLINNWEATYFDFNTEKLLNIAREAKKFGIEMLVMDDGWFGKRNSDNGSLGDWVVNEEKIEGGLHYLVSEINKLGMKFGIWFEPEMVSPDSDLYRTHPDWVLEIPGRKAALCRNQYILDLTRTKVRDYVFNSLSNILNSANIEYVKWDMNRQLTDVGSYAHGEYHQGEIYHRYVLGVYDLMERLTKEFPHILLENCSGGGGRFDPGMLYYSPQIWCSDDTDAIERLEIQRGTALVYPLSCIGAHVSDCPNHIVSRTTPFETRGYVALSGTFGYELDITKITEEEKKLIPKQIAQFHKYSDLIRTGDYYRILAGVDCNYDCWQIISKDKTETLITIIQILGRPNVHSKRIRLKGLVKDEMYCDSESGECYSGGALMHAGILVPNLDGDFKGKIYHFIKE